LTDLVQGDTEDVTNQDPCIVEGLGCRPHSDPSVRFGPAHAGFGFKLSVVDPRGDKLVFHDHIGFLEALPHVALDNLPSAGDIVLNRDLLVFQVDLVVNQVACCSQSLVHAQVGGENLPINLDGLGRPDSQLLGLGCYGTKGIADLPNVICEDLPVLIGTSRNRNLADVEVLLRNILETQTNSTYLLRL
jgi:hypothetical protein